MVSAVFGTTFCLAPVFLGCTALALIIEFTDNASVCPLKSFRSLTYVFKESNDAFSSEEIMFFMGD